MWILRTQIGYFLGHIVTEDINSYPKKMIQNYSISKISKELKPFLNLFECIKSLFEICSYNQIFNPIFEAAHSSREKQRIQKLFQ